MPKGYPATKAKPEEVVPVVPVVPQDVPGLNPIALEALQVEADAFVASDAATEQGLFEVPPPQDNDHVAKGCELFPEPEEPMWVDYTPTEIRGQDAFYLWQRAKQWREEVAYEQLKAAANQTTILAMNWAATQLEQMADSILLFPLNREVTPIEENDPEPDAPIT